MASESNWDKLLKGIDFDLSDGQGPPDLEKLKSLENQKMSGKKVFVQKIITEVWVYTDIEGKTFSHQGIQDIAIAGEMLYEDVIKLIEERRNKKNKRG